MSKTLIIAEKPSVAKDIAAALGVPRVADVYENDSLVVSNCRGHLVELFDKQAEDRKLKPPIIPKPFSLRVAQGCNDQYQVLKKLMARSDITRVANACDAGREGEAIFRLVYEMAGCKKPIERLWLQSMTKGGIKDAWESREPGTKYDALADAARSRSEADWIVGINGSRAFYAAVGRVMTPTLALVYERYMANKNFVPKDYFEVVGTFGVAAGEYKAKWVQPAHIKQIEDVAIAEAIVAKCKGVAPSSISDESKPSKEAAPFLFDLTSLQREANKRFKFSAKKTLDVAQALYEKHKVTSYPRTDSQRLPEDYVGQCASTLKALSGIRQFGELAIKPVNEGWVKPNKRIFDNSKISDHFAIIPTGVIPEGLSSDEEKIFGLVSRRFIAIFYPDAEYHNTVRTTIVEGETFRASGRVQVKKGWREVVSTADAEEKEPPLPKLEQDETGETLDVKVSKLQTKAPPLYTEATLLTAMETAGKALDDEELADAMKERGLGTPATRAATIEKLLDPGKTGAQMAREGDKLIPTEKGCAIIERLKKLEPRLVSPVLTGEWESKLLQMEKGKYSRPGFMQEIEKFVLEMVAVAAKNVVSSQGAEPVDFPQACPNCGEKLVFDGRTVRHPEKGECEFTVWATVSQRKLTSQELETLISKGELPIARGFKTKTGAPFSAGMKLIKETGKVEFFFAAATASKIPCPRCSKGLMLNGKKAECECGFSLWTTIAKLQLTEEQIAQLVNGKTEIINGFKSKTGSEFSAALLFNKEKEEVSFDFTGVNSTPKASKHKDGDKCPKCGKGKLGYRQNKEGKHFLGCSKYPSCKFFEWKA